MSSHEKNDKIANYLKVLLRLRLVRKIKPVTEGADSKKSIYRIADNMFRFHYKYILTAKEQLEEGNADIVYEVIMSNMTEYIGHIFEDICIQFIKRLNRMQSLPVFYEKLGKWWGTDKRTKTQQEIDIMAVGKDSAIFGECKYRNEVTGEKELGKLINKSDNFIYKDKYYFLFSKNGFTISLAEKAKKQSNVFLFGLEDIFKI